MSKEVLCDYCGCSNQPKTVISAQKTLCGHKFHDVLQFVTQQDLPANLAIKVCFLCAATLMSTMGVINKTLQLVENAMMGATAAKNKKASIETEEEPNKSGVGITAEAEAKSAKPLAKNVTLRQRSKSMAERSSDLIFPRTSVKKIDKLNVSLSKTTPKKNTSRLDDSLDDSVRLTPAKEMAANKKVFVQLFGSRNGDGTPESEEEEEDENVDENAEKVIALKTGFDCKLCDFQVRAAKAFKEHLFNEHGQQRPRIYFCDLCPKSFGVLKSWRVHIEKVHGVTVEAKQKEAKAKVPKAKEQQSKDDKGDEVKPIEKSPGKGKSSKASKELETKDSKNDEVEPIEKSPRKEKSNKAPKEQQTKDSKNDEVEPIEKSPRKEKSNKAPKEQQTKDSENDVVKPLEKSPQKAKSNKANEKNEAKEDVNETSPWPQLATIKALNGEEVPKKKWLDKVISNPDYTFDVNGSSASTPKAADLSIQLSKEFNCDICDSQLTTAKQMQEHMKDAHGIDKPKVFKCPVCDKSLSTNQTLKHHMNLHNKGGEVQKSIKRKILQEEQNVDIVDSIPEKSPAEEDDEQPQEEKILHTKEEILEIDSNTADESLMAPPKVIEKKPKKAKSSPKTLAVVDLDSPSKKRKNKELDEPSNTVDLMEEINTNVKPHKKARLQSVSDSFSSSFDDYSTAEEPLLSCSQCGKEVKSKQRLALHIRKRHGTKLECPGCKTSYTNQRDYVNHFAVCSSGGSLLPCGVGKCKKSFYEANYLSSHLSLKHQWT